MRDAENLTITAQRRDLTALRNAYRSLMRHGATRAKRLSVASFTSQYWKSRLTLGKLHRLMWRSLPTMYGSI